MCYKGLVILAFILLLFWRTDVLENIGHYNNIVKWGKMHKYIF